MTIKCAYSSCPLLPPPNIILHLRSISVEEGHPGFSFGTLDLPYRIRSVWTVWKVLHWPVCSQDGNINKFAQPSQPSQPSNNKTIILSFIILLQCVILLILNSWDKIVEVTYLFVKKSWNSLHIYKQHQNFNSREQLLIFFFGASAST